MRQHAWLNAVPERPKGAKADAPRLTRLEQMREGNASFEPEMPPASAEYLIAYLFEVGPSVTSGGYSSAVSSQELVAWSGLVGIDLQPWETRFLLGLSRQHVSQTYRSERAGCPEPLLEELGRGGVQAALVAKDLKRLVEEMSRL